MSSYREEALWRLARWAVVGKSTIHRLVEGYKGALAEALWEIGVKGGEIPPLRSGQKEEIGISLDEVMVWVEDNGELL